MVFAYAGMPTEALGCSKHAKRLFPIPLANNLTELGHDHLLLGEPARAIAPLRHFNPDFRRIL